MEEVLFFIFGLIAEALGLKAKKKTPLGPPASPVMPPRRPPLMPMPAASGGPARPPTFVRRPDTGGPAVPREATTADFARAEAALIAEQEAPSPAPPLLGAGEPPSATPALALFTGPEDLVRAFILQEVLGPPLSRRHTPR